MSPGTWEKVMGVAVVVGGVTLVVILVMILTGLLVMAGL